MKLSIRVGLHGRGVFADEAIHQGQKIMDFTGPFLRQSQTTPETYALQIEPDLYIGASGGFDDYVNHSCQPNAGMLIEGRQVRLVAILPIAAGEEIFFDYSTTMDEDDWEMTCRCGSPGCRKIVRDGKHLPPEGWDRYLELGILPYYVRDGRRRLAAALKSPGGL
jgi:SET domain-containing protein